MRWWRRLRRWVETAQGVWRVLSIGQTVIVSVMPSVLFGPQVGCWLGLPVVVLGLVGWKCGSTVATPRRLDECARRCIVYGESLSVVYLAFELGLPLVGLRVPIIYSSRQWF